MKKTIIILIIAGATIIAGCNSVNSDWETAIKAKTIEAYQWFLEKHPDSERAGEATKRINELVITSSLARDLDKIIARIPSGESRAMGSAPGSIYTLGDDIPFVPEESIHLEAFGDCTFEGLALKDGALKVLEDGTYLFATVKVTVASEDKVRMTIFLKLSDEPSQIDPTHTSSATVDGVVYNLSSETGIWQQTS